MAIRLSDRFSYGRLARFALPSIAMMIFISIYSMVDGLFVSNFTGKEALAAVNLVYPLAMALGSIGFMFGTGGAALVAKTMGEGDEVRANRLFTFIALAAAALSVVLCAVGAFALEPLLGFLGADGQLLDLSLLYGRVLLAALPFSVLAEHVPKLLHRSREAVRGTGGDGGRRPFQHRAGLPVHCRVRLGHRGRRRGHDGGAGAGSGRVRGVLRAQQDEPPALRAARARPPRARQGVRERVVRLMTEVAASVVSTLYNFQLLMLLGADGVAAYGVIMYVNFVFTAVFFGFAMGTGPVVSYHYGAQNKDELKSLFRKSLVLVGGAGVTMFAASQLFGGALVGVFVGYDPDLVALTLHGFRIYSVSFLMAGFNIYGSAFFTALNNGKVSALVSFMRTLVFETSTVMLLPLVWGVDGVWSAIIVAEACALVLTVGFLVYLRKPYGYA